MTGLENSFNRKKIKKKCYFYLKRNKKVSIFATAFGKSQNTQGEMAEWSNAAVLKTVEGHTSGGSNPSFSAKTSKFTFRGFFIS